ncbi:hypothetical protein QFZ67_004155 [Streptomyces sp. V1I1]|nr:hypothetical protein [Streptomyces sp. V1I1]
MVAGGFPHSGACGGPWRRGTRGAGGSFSPTPPLPETGGTAPRPPGGEGEGTWGLTPPHPRLLRWLRRGARESGAGAPASHRAAASRPRAGPNRVPPVGEGPCRVVPAGDRRPDPVINTNPFTPPAPRSRARRGPGTRAARHRATPRPAPRTAAPRNAPPPEANRSRTSGGLPSPMGTASPSPGANPPPSGRRPGPGPPPPVPSPGGPRRSSSTAGPSAPPP